MQEAAVRKIIAFYGLHCRAVLPGQKGYRNSSFPVTLQDGRMVNFILYKNERGMADRIKRANAAADFLAARGFAVRSTVDHRIIRIADSTGERYGALYDYLPGQTIPWEAYSRKHLKLLGKMMGDMHATLAELPKGNLPSVAEEYRAIVGRMRQYFGDPQVSQAMTRKLGLKLSEQRFDFYRELLQLCRQLPRQQALHMDFVRGNILFDATPRITGILDFEKAAYGHPLFDIARTLAFLLVDCKHKPPAEVRKSFLLSGYMRLGAARFTNVTLRWHGRTAVLLDQLTDLFLLYDFYKFLRHNPYEYLPDNEHFVRTRAALIGRGLLIAL